MKTKIVKIGNSRGIRIPKSFIDESGVKNEVEIEIDDGKIIIKPISEARASWDAAYRKMAGKGDDVLLDSKVLKKQSKWDEEEWEW